MCKSMGVICAGNIVDHIVPHKGNMKLFFEGPFQTLCVTHHNSTKQRMEKSGDYGCDENGMVTGWK